MRKFRFAVAALAGISTFPGISLAQETSAYKYDALGRLISSRQTGGPSDGKITCYTYDKAGNRTNVTIGTAACAADPGSPTGPGTSTDTGFVVVPLNGYTLIYFKK